MNRYQELAIEQTCMSEGHYCRWEQIRYDAEAYRQYTVDALEYIDKQTPMNTVIDIGCAYGTLSAYLSCKGWGRVVALDINPLPYLPFLEKYNVEFQQVDIERNKLEGSYELVICTEVLEHLGHNPRGAMKRLYSITEPGGCIILSTPDRDKDCWKMGGSLQQGFHPVRSYVKIRGDHTGNIDDHYYHYTANEAASILERSGFKVSTCEIKQNHIYIVGYKETGLI